jgi:predicted nucleotidyltransferase
MHNFIINKKLELIKICKDLNIKRMNIFGSAVTNSFNDESDIDFLISFNEEISNKEYADNYFKLHYKLRELFNRKIDIITERTLSNPYFIKSINNTKELVYEA